MAVCAQKEVRVVDESSTLPGRAVVLTFRESIIAKKLDDSIHGNPTLKITLYRSSSVHSSRAFYKYK